MPTVRPLFFCLLFVASAAAQNPALPMAEVQVEPLVQSLRLALEERRWLDATRSFEAAWQQLQDGEDQIPGIHFEGTRTLEPGQHQFQAGARAQLRQIFQTAAPAFREEYQRQYDAPARGRLQDAIRRGHREDVRELVRRHEFCHSADASLRWLISDAVARGEWQTSALLLRQRSARSGQQSASLELLLGEVWLKAGFEAESEAAVRRAVRLAGAGAEVTWGTRRLRLPESASDVSGWLARELGLPPSGADSSQVVSSGRTEHLSSQAGIPGRMRPAWEFSTFQSATQPQLNDRLRSLELRSLAMTDRDPPAPAIPVVTADLVICQAAGTLRAVDRRTGEFVWESSQFNHQLQSALQRPADQNRRQVFLSLADMILRDAARNHLRGQMVTDGRLLYCVEETSQGLNTRFAGTATSLLDRHQNVLRVYDVATGRLRGQVGGIVAAGAPANADPLSAMYFLGAPLLLQDRVLILAEDPQGIHLLDLRLTPASGEPDAELKPEIVDRQLLSVPLYELPVHPVRRLSGITPRFSDGMLICHACDEQVIGLSSTDLSIEWIHRYRATVRPKEIGGGDPVFGNAATDAESRIRDIRSRPHDSAARLVDSRILLMPRDSDQLICLDMLTGQELWSRSRGDWRYMAAVTDRLVILAGSTSLVALAVADGHEVWRQEMAETAVSAQPAATDQLVYLPTQRGRVLVMEIETGRRLLELPLADAAVGNLISAPGQLIAQTLTRVTCWQPTKSASESTLPTIEALLLANEPEQAVDQLTAALETATGERLQAVRSLLTEQLLESLRLDYEASRPQIPLLRELIAASSLTPVQMAEAIGASFGLTLNDSVLLRDTWNMVRQTSRQQNRLDSLIVEGLATHAGLTVDKVVSEVAAILPAALTPPDRVVRSGRIRLRASGQKAAAIQQALSTLDEASRAVAVDQLRPVVRRLLSRDSAGQQFPQQVWFCWNAGLADCLLPIEKSELDLLSAASRPAQVTQLLASKLAGWLQIEQAHEMLRTCWDRIEPVSVDDWPAVAELSKGPANDPVGRIADLLSQKRSVRTWRRQPQVTPGEAHAASSERRAVDGAPSSRIPVRGTPGAFRGWHFARQFDRREILAIDAEGRRRWEFNPARNGQIQIRPHQSGIRRLDYAVACGRLLAFTDSDRLFMLNADEVTDGSPEALWYADLDQLLPNATRHQQFPRSWERTTMYDRRPDGLAPIGPLTEAGLALFRGDQLMVLNPFDGSPLWRQDGLPDDTRLTAADADLCLISESTSQIQVRNMRDGSVRRTGRLPSWWADGNALYDTSVRHVDLEPGTEIPWRIAVEGTRCLMFTLDPERARLTSWSLTDVDDDGPNVLWQTELPADTVFSNVCDGRIATLSDGRRLQIRQISDGTVMCDQDVPPAERCDWLYLRRSGDRFLVLTYAPHTGEAPLPVINAVPLNGPIYAIDARDGSVVWTDQASDEHLRILNAGNMTTLPSAPLVILLRRRSRQAPGGRLRGAAYGARILNVSDGKLLYEDDDLGTNLSYHVLRFDDDGLFTVNFERRAIEFDYRPEVERR